MKYVTLSTATEINGNDYFDLLLQQFLEKFKHTDIYTFGYLLTSELHQTISMEKEGIIVVSSRKHRAYQKYVKIIN